MSVLSKSDKISSKYLKRIDQIDEVYFEFLNSFSNICPISSVRQNGLFGLI